MQSNVATPNSEPKQCAVPRQPSPSIPGFAVAKGPDGRPYHVPNFMVPAAELALHTPAVQDGLGVCGENDGPRQHTNSTYAALGNGIVISPPDPPITRREATVVQADILALQETLGISYKDAAHRLYQTRLREAEAQHALRQSLAVSRQKVLAVMADHLYPEVKKLDEKIFGRPQGPPRSEGGSPTGEDCSQSE